MTHRAAILLAAVFLPAAGADKPAPSIWNEMEAKRSAVPSFHQEFELKRVLRTSRSERASLRRVVVDRAGTKWREQNAGGSGDRIRLFDGADLLEMDSGGDEYVRVRRKSGDPAPEPDLYNPATRAWAKATEVERKACPMTDVKHTCVLIKVPLTPWTRNPTPTRHLAMIEGLEQILFDTDTGLIVISATVENIDDRNGGYRVENGFSLRRMSYGPAIDAALFALPAGVREVKEFSPWSIDAFRKTLVGKPAPELELTDLHGNPLTLSDLKGKTVLLDFWATWCPPCRADAPALEKLYQRYGTKDLALVGISVDEERAVVEKFLRERKQSYPVTLTTENELPRVYQVGVLPTYVVIDADGKVTAALDGDQGFRELSKVLKKAGISTE